MRKSIVSAAIVFLAPVVLVVLASARTPTSRQVPGAGFEATGALVMTLGADTSKAVVTLTSRGSGASPLYFVVLRRTAGPLEFSGDARVTYKPGVLTIQTASNVGWQFAVKREGVFVPQVSAIIHRETVTGIAFYTAPPQMAAADFASVLLGTARAQVSAAGVYSVIPSIGGDAADSCPDGAPDTCSGGGTGSSSCQYGCATTSCGVTCSNGFYSCCWCLPPAKCGCCPNPPGRPIASRESR